MSEHSAENDPVAELADTVEDATSGTLNYDVCWQIAQYLTASGYTRVTPPGVTDD